MAIRVKRHANVSKQATLLDGLDVSPLKWRVCGCGLNRFVHEGMNHISNVKVQLKTRSGNVNKGIMTPAASSSAAAASSSSAAASSSSVFHTFGFRSITLEGMHQFHSNSTEESNIIKYRSSSIKGIIPPPSPADLGVLICSRTHRDYL